MKKTNESSKTVANFNLLIAETSEVEILNLEAMSCVRGGEGEGTEPIIIKPKI